MGGVGLDPRGARDRVRGNSMVKLFFGSIVSPAFPKFFVSCFVHATKVGFEEQGE